MKRLLLIVALIAVASPAVSAQDQGIDSINRGRLQSMLKMIKEDLKDNYYDRNYHGVDIEKVFKDAEAQLQQASSMGRALGIIASTLDTLNDSHTFFLPPPRPYRHDYGWKMTMIGDRCFVIAVKPGSDAEAKGLKPGDELLSVGPYSPSRELLWKMKYVLNVLRPQTNLTLTIRTPKGEQRSLDLATEMKATTLRVGMGDGLSDWYDLIRDSENQARLIRQRWVEMDDLFIWKMPQFNMTEGEVDEMMGRVRKRKMLILDLRGNPGGYVIMLKRLVGHFFENEVKIGDTVWRKKTEEELAKSRGRDIFTGKVVVLVDSDSGSAAEVFARVMQIEKRGTVVGDRSAGAVMTSRQYGHMAGMQDAVPFGASVTVSDLIMTDGKSLEKIGVTPGEIILPTGADLAASRDPVLSRAAVLLGVHLSPEQAGKLFPIEWLNK